MSSNTQRSRPLVDLEQVGKVFQTEEIETHALNRVDLSINESDFLAIVGPSGAGKTTLLAILALLDHPSDGTYRLQGHSVTDLTDAGLARLRNENIGIIFQTFNLIGNLSVAANVELPLVYRGLSREARRSSVEEALERVGMGHRARHRPGQLSGGQQQRVAVARALVGKPQLLLADEPTGNLDSANGEMVMQLIADLHAAGSTICMVTHDHRFATLAERTVRLVDGSIVEEQA